MNEDTRISSSTWHSIPVKNFDVEQLHVAIYRETDVSRHYGWTIATEDGDILDEDWDASGPRQAEKQAREAVRVAKAER